MMSAWFPLIFIACMFGGIIVVLACIGVIQGIGFRNFSILIGLIAVTVGIVIYFAGDTALGGSIISVVLLITAICCVTALIKKLIAAERRKAYEIDRLIEDRKKRRREFYEQCKKADISELKTAYQKQRAILYAKEYGIAEEDVEDVIKSQHKAIEAEQAAERARVEKQRTAKREKENADKYRKDVEEQQKMKTPYPYFGQEKKIAFWQEKLDECNRIIEALEMEIQQYQNSRDRALNNSKFESQVDWAVAGGIGSAIGGAGAGVMAALEAQAENERIGQRNERKAAFLLDYAKNSITVQREVEAKKREQVKIRSKYEDEIKRLQLKLVDKIKKDNPLSLLTIRFVGVSETNLEVDVSLKRKALIFEEVEAVCDGAFWAHIYQDKEYVGSVRVILPYEGVNTKKTRVTVQTSLGIDSQKECYVEYEAEKLWLIEK